ncbi:hypothetical protein K503DRAFT_797963 [Rhizopogon vinicolor AM-OR11-026]|uniref:Uncharacterized protein n=1 Tax=Rhizopogon vinicolor AM-OR11-026 TaxID=1314800 RepID=A0A1B7N9A6_9AGAM|nr:hypothetical protein K503DRAFT_797963 [Rhizopogon vinicolor AM-OR11-026]
MSRTCEKSHETVKQAEGQLAESQVEQEGKLYELDQMKAKMVDLRETIKTCKKGSFQATQASVQELGTRLYIAEQSPGQLTKFKETGSIDDFHDRLASLGTITETYDIAVSAAYNALNNMVIDTVAQDQHITEQSPGQLIKFKETGSIDDFHDRLASLGTIAGKYDIAVSAAYNALNNMEIDTVAQDQVYIEFLRKQNTACAS